MSIYYKAEDVINLLATEYYTYKQAEIIEVEDCKAAATFNARHIPTIDIVTCDECKRWVGESEWYEDREYRQCQNGGLLTSLNHYCAWGERSEE